MIVKTNGRAALSLVAGVFLLFGAPLQAAPGSASKSDSAGKQADAVQSGKHRRHSARHASSNKAP